MDLYHIALFVHILALIAAAGATTVVKLAAARRVRARTLGDALEWHRVMMAAATTFPIAIVTFLLTGGYMVSRTGAQTWTAGFVVAGLVGLALLFASGTYLGIKGKGLAAALEGMIARNGPDQAPPRMAPPKLVVALPVVNTAIAIAVAFDMVTKPASVPVALTVLAVGILAGFAVVALGGSKASAPVAAGESPFPAGQ